MPPFPSRLDALDDDTRSALRALARSSFDDTDPPDKTRLDAARVHGILVADDDLFADGDAHAQALAESVVAEALAALDSPVALADLLHTLWNLSFRGRVASAAPQAGPGARLLVSLADEGYDVLSLLPGLYTASNDAPPRRSTSVAVTLALQRLEPTPAQALAVARAAARVTNIRTTGTNHAGLAGVAQDLDVATQLLDALDLADPVDAALAPHVVHGMAATDLLAGLRRAALYANDPDTAAIGVLALGGLPLAPDTDEAHQAVDLLDRLAGAHPAEVAEALQRLVDVADPSRTTQILTRVAGTEGGGNAAALAMLLSHTTSPSALQALAGSVSLTVEGLDHLHSILSPLSTTAPEAVLDVAEAYVVQRPYGTGAVPGLSDAFPHALGNVTNDAWSRRLPLWFGHAEARLRQAAADIVQDGGLNQSWAFHPDVLDSLGDADLLFLIRQALGLVRSGPVLARLVLSVFDAPSLSVVARTFATTHLAGFVTDAYPGDVLEVCEAIGTDRGGAYAAAQVTIPAIRAAWAARARTRPCTELGAPQVRTRAHEVGEARLQQHYLDAAREANPSIIESLFTSVETRAGAGFGTQMADGTVTISPNQEIRMESNAPWGDMVDPLGMRLRRLHFLSLPRGADSELFAPTP